MTTILVDRISSVALHHGILRVNCTANGPNGEDHSTGTLLIPANQLGAVMKSLLNATKEVDRLIREQLQQAVAKSGAPPADFEEAIVPPPPPN